MCGSSKGFRQQQWPLGSFKVIVLLFDRPHTISYYQSSIAYTGSKYDVTIKNVTILRPCHVSCTGFLSDDELNARSHDLFTSRCQARRMCTWRMTSQLPNLRTFMTSSPLNVLAVLALHPSLLLLGHLHHPLKTTDRSFRYASPCFWNQLSLSLRKPHSGTSSSISCSPIPSPITSFSDSPLCTSITPSLFHSRLKTYLFHKSYPPQPQFHFFLPDCLHGLLPAPFLMSYSVFHFFPYFSFLGHALD